MSTLLLKRLSLGSVEVQTSQSQPIMGTPLLVPVPKNVMVRDGICTDQIYGNIGRHGMRISRKKLSFGG